MARLGFLRRAQSWGGAGITQPTAGGFSLAGSQAGWRLIGLDTRVAVTARLKIALITETKASGPGRGHRHGNIEPVLPLVVAPQLAQTAKDERESS